MLTTPYRIGPARDVEPGALIEHERGPFVVDEVRRTGEGLTILGWPRHRVGGGRRITIDRKVDEEVVFLPDSEEERDLLRQQLLQQLLHAVKTGAGCDVDHGDVLLTVRGREWRVGFDPSYVAGAVEAEIIDETDDGDE